MKKRKFPAGLIIAFVVLLGGAGAYSVYNTTVANRTPEENAQILQAEAMANAPKPPTGREPAVESPDAVRQRIQSVASGAGGKEGPEGRGPGGPPAAPGSSILAPKPEKYKPTPNESATSSQWYQNKK